MTLATITSLLFWLSLAWVAWVYAGYPLGAWLLNRAAGKPVRRGAFEPRVSVLIAAHNEESCIAATLHNKLGLDYPADRLEIFVISDSSTDRTDAIVTEIARDSQIPVRLLRQEDHAGKTAALNRAVPQATGSILVFSDANSIYARDAVARLVENFADSRVGYVTGRMLYQTETESGIAEGCSAYMRYENLLREAESGIGSVIGVDGGIDAVRADLYRTMEADDLPDFMLPLSVAERGYKVAYDPRAKLYEDALDEAADEFRMRVRVSLRAMWTLWKKRRLLNPLWYGMLAIQLWSHKVMRYLCFVPAFALWPLSAILMTSHWVYFAAFLAQTAVYGALLLRLFDKAEGFVPKLLNLARYFTLLNLACAVALGKFLRGERKAVWTPRTG
jgi:cellulose synthase/poly-beta-1,6-N-acetylglucosamine synthase-like glycosyltransferase